MSDPYAGAESPRSAYSRRKHPPNSLRGSAAKFQHGRHETNFPSCTVLDQIERFRLERKNIFMTVKYQQDGATLNANTC